MLELVPVFPPIFLLDLFQVLRLPMEAHKPADEELGTIFAGLGDRLVEEESVADGAVENTVENVSKGFALSVRGG